MNVWRRSSFRAASSAAIDYRAWASHLRMTCHPPLNVCSGRCAHLSMERSLTPWPLPSSLHPPVGSCHLALPSLVHKLCPLKPEVLGRHPQSDLIYKGPVAKVAPSASEHTHLMAYYDQSESGETTAQPHLRVPPLRNRGGHLQKFMSLIMSKNPRRIYMSSMMLVGRGIAPPSSTALFSQIQMVASWSSIRSMLGNLP